MIIKNLISNSYIIDFDNINFEKLKNSIKNSNIVDKWFAMGEFIYDILWNCEQDNTFLLADLYKILLSILNLGLMYPYKYTYYDFESWLVKTKPKAKVDKIMQLIFGIGENKIIKHIQFGDCKELDDLPHIVTGHKNPDMDAMVTSFCSWINASGMRISSVSNVWNISGTISSVEAESLFDKIFGSHFFDLFAVRSHVFSLKLVSLPWVVVNDHEYEIESDDITVNISDDLNDVSEVLLFTDKNIKLVLSDMNSKYVIGVIKPYMSHKVASISIRDFNDVTNFKYIKVRSIIDHHIPGMDIKDSCLVRLSNNQSCSSMLLEDLYEEFIMMKSKKFDVSKIAINIKLICLLFGILDDTDHLEKFSFGDCIAMAKSLNMLVFFLQGSRVLHWIDIIKKDIDVAKSYVIKNKYFKSFLQMSKDVKKSSIEFLIKNAVDASMGLDAKIFADTKVQNKHFAIGQIKLMTDNWSDFKSCLSNIQYKWFKKSELESKKHKTPVHIMMISTIDCKTDKEHDIWWLWEDRCEKCNFSKDFLLNIAKSEFKDSIRKIEIKHSSFDDCIHDLKDEFKSAFNKADITVNYSTSEGPSIVIHVVRGSMNSRKKVVTPFLPKI